MKNPKIPPQDEHAEQSVLGAILIDKDSISFVSEILKPSDFYNDTNRIIYKAMLALYDDRKPVDVLTLTARLKKEKIFDKVGGAYLAELVDSVPTAANIVHYAQIIKEAAVKRQLIQIGTEVAEMGFLADKEVREILDKAESTIFAISQTHSTRGFVQIKDVVARSYEKVAELHKMGIGLRGIKTGFSDIDNMLSGMQEANLIILAARPGQGKTAMAVNIAQHVAVGDKNPVGIFSLEMSQEELVDRLLVGQADIDAWRLKTGKLSDTDFDRLAHAMGQLGEAPIFIDDTPGLTISEMRTKARKLQLEAGIKLLIVDYLQLVDPGRRYDSRVQEVAIVSQALKNLARELKIPVLSLSQLSRAVEHRGEKKPQLADLRESGCLTGETQIMRADSGELITLKELVDSKKAIPVLGLDQDWKLKVFPMVKAFSSGIKKVYRLKLSSGRQIRASGNHLFRKLYDWKRLDQLKIGDRIAIPRVLPLQHEEKTSVEENKLLFLAHMIGDGCYLKNQPIHYTSANMLSIQVVHHASTAFGVTATVVPQENWLHLYLTNHGKNPIIDWFKKLNIYDQRSYQKVLPQFIFTLPLRKIAFFISHLWATGGNISHGLPPHRWAIYYATRSKTLGYQLQHLLLRLGIIARVRTSPKKGYRLMYHVVISGKTEQIKFLSAVGVFSKDEIVKKAMDELSKTSENPNVDVIPKEIWLEIKKVRKLHGFSTREFHKKLGWAYSGTQRLGNGVSRTRLKHILTLVSNRFLENIAQSDIFWDEITDILQEGEEEVYDATVPGCHNFIANDIIAHNSIEQDSDVVMFLYRPEEEVTSPTVSVKVLVAKHRNGPTGEIDLLFRGDRIRFYNMDVKHHEV